MLLNVMTRPTAFGNVHQSVFKTSAQLEFLKVLLEQKCPAELALALLKETESNGYVVMDDFKYREEQARHADQIQKRAQMERNLAFHVNDLRTAMDNTILKLRRMSETLDMRVRTTAERRAERKRIKKLTIEARALISSALGSPIPPGTTYNVTVNPSGFQFCSVEQAVSATTKKA